VHLIRAELLPGSVELEQDLVFPGPVYAGDDLTIDAVVVRVDAMLGHVEVRTRIVRGGDGVGCEGRTLVSADV
jgi:acyl dehydratase